MTPKSLFFFSTTLALLILLIPISAQISDPNPKLTQSLSAAHTELTNYGFPVGLLPSSVHGYSINKTSGDFSVELGATARSLSHRDPIHRRRLGVRGRHGQRQVPFQELRREPRLRR
uniref:Uncharacterized protein n=1 Tax=Quercus lobata TaxID=97700 RepID=A0A7N2MHC1_QUELO